jgi:hypothetical protein
MKNSYRCREYKAMISLFIFFLFGFFLLATTVPGGDEGFVIAGSGKPSAPVEEGNPYRVQPIREVSSKAPPRVVDIASTDAKLIFTSSIPLACSVVYGKTISYGMISTDQDMGGGDHTDHGLLLINLEPDTEYHYRVQGTSGDGTIYVGEDLVFQTLPEEDKTEMNLASLDERARVVRVSSNFGGASDSDRWGADSALDGKRATAWSSNGDGDDAFIEIEFRSSSQIYAVEVWTRSMSDGTAIIKSFTLTTDSGETHGPFTLEDDKKAHRYDIDTVTTTIRLDVVDSTGGNTGLIEIAAYGTPLDE